jgi:hypothetical protein
VLSWCCQVRDLLSSPTPSVQQRGLAIREDASGNIVLAGIKEVGVATLQHVNELLHQVRDNTRGASNSDAGDDY